MAREWAADAAQLPAAQPSHTQAIGADAGQDVAAGPEALGPCWYPLHLARRDLSLREVDGDGSTLASLATSLDF